MLAGTVASSALSLTVEEMDLLEYIATHREQASPEDLRWVDRVLGSIRSPDHPQQSFYSFLRCLKTVDKARGGQVRPWPFDDNTRADPKGRSWDAYWRDWELALLQCPRLLVDKNRRTMATNLMSAFDLWVASGGQDARWEALMLSVRNRHVLIQGRKAEGPGGSEEFLGRVAELYQASLPSIKAEWVDFPVWQFNVKSATNSWGGKIDAVPQGADQVRGPGPTLIHDEEVSAWEQAQASIETAMASLAADNPEGGTIGGHLVAVCTPSNPSYPKSIREGKVQSRGHTLPPIPKTEYIPIYRKGDWDILDIDGRDHVPHWRAELVGQGMGQQMYQREVLKDWDASTGKLVYPDFGSIHCSREPLSYDPTLPLALGWDQGGTAAGGNPACVIGQLQRSGSLYLYMAFAPEENETVTIYEFGRAVAEYLAEEFAEPLNKKLEDLDLVHFGDPAGKVRPKTRRAISGKIESADETRSCWEQLRLGTRIPIGWDERRDEPLYEERPGWGWKVQDGEVSFSKRSKSVEDRLVANLKGIPLLQVDPGATLILTAFKGGYRYAERVDGRFELDPKKDRNAEVMNALEYLCSRTDRIRPRSAREQSTYLEPWSSPASGVGR
jgi:hypothetical protein